MLIAGVFCGMAIAVLLGGVIFGSVKAVEWIDKSIHDLCKGLADIGQLSEQNKKLAEMAQMVATELQMLRSAVSAQAPGGEVQEEDPVRRTKPGTRPPFPTMTPVIYDIPDAKEEELEISDTDDATMAQIEKLEEIRQQGFEADPAELDGN